MKHKTAAKMLMVITDRNTANEYLDKCEGLSNRELVLAYINYTIIIDACKTGEIEPIVERVKRLNMDKLFLRRNIRE